MNKKYILFIIAFLLALSFLWLEIKKESSPTPTPNPTPTQVITPTPNSSAFSKPIGHLAKFFPNTKQYLKAGDVLSAATSRGDSPENPMTTNNAKWIKAMQDLNSVNLEGVEKHLLLSATEDAKNLIGYVPDDVDYIGYNMEGGMTPESDFTDVAASVKAFADIVHNSGRKMVFGPIWKDWDKYSSSTLNDILKAVDEVVIQEQANLRNTYDNNGYNDFINDVKTKTEKFKKINPNVKINIQLWIGRQMPQQMINGFKLIEQHVDSVSIGTQEAEAGVITVLQGLGR